MLACAGTAAVASTEPLYAPAPEWVEPAAIPEAEEQPGSVPARLLLIDQQALFGVGEDQFYLELATRIETPQGLAAAGSVILPWNPEFGDLTVHKVHILRDGETIDVLAGGQKFVTLRRENNLEMAMLDGVLTAVMQPEGLQIGDVLDIAFSISRRHKSIPFRSENLTAFLGQAAEEYRLRQVWPKSMKMDWRATGVFEGAKLGEDGGFKELQIVLEDTEAAGAPPEGAPARFALPSILQATAYSDWAELAVLMAPSYAEATTLAADSALRREAEKIAAASTDPHERAIAALRLVQDRIRYVALAMNEGGYIPARADETWARRFGDCKGKTAVLVALLKELGIEAQPMLVSTRGGDMLDTLLPSVMMFDHVIVRARIGGKTYWLDGTRMGDRDLADLESSPFGWGLPIVAEGAALLPPVTVPPSRSFAHTDLRIDSSKGLDLPATMRGEYRFRGVPAVQYNGLLSSVSPADAEKQLRDYWNGRIGDLEIESVEHRYDDARSEMTLTVIGKAELGWYDTPDRASRRRLFDHDVVNWTIDLEREAKPASDAPFAVPFPTYVTSTETIKLPHAGRGFSVDGGDLTLTAAGAQITRKVAIEGDTATASSSFRTIAQEIPAAQAATDAPKIKEANDAKAYVRAPSNYAETADERRATLDVEPTTADEFFERGATLLTQYRLAKAMEDLEKAIALDPKHAFAVANRGIAHFWLGDSEKASADFDRASALDPGNYVASNGRGLIFSRQGRLDEAIGAFSRAIDSNPSDEFAYRQRASLRMRQGDAKAALADLDRGLELAPDHLPYLADRASIYEAESKPDEAIADLDRIIELDDDASWASMRKGKILLDRGDEAAAKVAFDLAAAAIDRMLAQDEITLGAARADLMDTRGEHGEALATLDALIKANPDNKMLRNNRCWLRATAGEALDRALADCNVAIEKDAGFAPALDSRAFVKLRMGKYDEAIADYGRALEIAPHMAASLFGRGIARIRSGEETAGRADIVAAEAQAWGIKREFADYGVTID